MEYGLSALSAIPMRAQANERAEMVNHLLFAECYEVVEVAEKWLLVRLQHDGYEGWIDRSQHHGVSAEYYESRKSARTPVAADLIEMVSHSKMEAYFPILLGSPLPFLENQQLDLDFAQYRFEGAYTGLEKEPEKLVEYASLYLGAPYLWGGRSPLGIDCSGLVQMVYRLCGYSIPRDSGQQAQLGTTLSFIEEAKAGDLAFFDNAEGKIVHVGLILPGSRILHASGKVRIDFLDQSGIFNVDTKKHSHRLRVLKSLIPH